MILPSVITSAICLFLGQAPSFTYANSLEARQGPVYFQILKSAPLGRRNLPGLDIDGSGRKPHDHGSGKPFFIPHHGDPKESASYGQDSYDSSQGGYDSGKEFYPSGNDKYGLDAGTFDLGTGTHHALQEGALNFGNGGYTGSDPGGESLSKPEASGSYGSGKKSYDSKTEKASSTKDNDYTSSKSYGPEKGSTPSYQDPHNLPSKDSGKKYESEVKDRGGYQKPPVKDNSKSTGETDYSKKNNSKDNGKYASPDGKKNSGYAGKDKSSDQEGSYIFEPGTTEEQYKAALKEGNKDGAGKGGDKPDEVGSPYNGPVKPAGKEDYSRQKS